MAWLLDIYESGKLILTPDMICPNCDTLIACKKHKWAYDNWFIWWYKKKFGEVPEINDYKKRNKKTKNEEVGYIDLKQNTLNQFDKGKKIKLMFVLESPNGKTSYFYNLDGDQTGVTGRLISPLEYNIPSYPSNISDKKERIRHFIEYGYLLTDLFHTPLNNVDNVMEHIDRLKDEIEEINPDKIVIMLPKKTFDKKNMELYIELINKNLGGKPIDNNDDFIDKEINIIQKLISCIKDEIEIKAAPFPATQGSLPDEWKKRDTYSFSDWVKENKDWLEIEEE